MAPGISVIMPVYNSAAYLSEAIQSVLNQTFQDFELLIIDDGSTDGSQEKILSYTDNRIKLFENSENRGPSYSRNKGFSYSQGTYIAFVDADDIALPDKFEKQFSYMEQHTHIGACGTYAEYIGTKTGDWKYPISDNEIRCRLMWGSSLINSTVFIRKKIIDLHNIRFNEQYRTAEDYKLWVDIGRVSELYNIPKVLLKYRVHSEQATATKKNLMDRTKSWIVIDQLRYAGVQILEKDFEVILKFISYLYDFDLSELSRLFEIYLEFIQKNSLSLLYDPQIIEAQIRDRLFEACYFSTEKCGVKAIQQYRNYFNFNDITLIGRLKFYYRSAKKYIPI